MRLLLSVLLILCLLVASPVWGSGPETALDPALRILLAQPEAISLESLAPQSSGTARDAIPRELLAGSSSWQESGRLEVLLQSAGPVLTSEEGLEVLEIGSGIYAARVSLSALRDLVNSGSLREARLSRPVYPNLDRSAEFLELSHIRRFDPETRSFTGTTGKGVTVGIVDSGVDWTHPDFDDPDGNTRIFRYWDQASPFGSPPADFPFGQEYRQVSIDRGVAGGLDSDGHGTHVLAIAAGSGRATVDEKGIHRYPGVAPDASLIVVRTVFTEFSVVLGVQFIMERAKLLGQPVVVNLSLGNHFGPHRGTTLFEKALDEMVGPGSLIVAAAGNDGARAIHAEMRLAPGETQTLEIALPDYNKVPNEFVFMNIEGWSDPANRYRFTVESPQGASLGAIEYGDLNRTYSDVKGMVRGGYSDDLDRRKLFLEVEDNIGSARRATGVWKLHVEALEVNGESDIDFWVVGWSGNIRGTYPSFASHVDYEETLVSPATSKKILAVGAVSTRSCWTNTSGQEACYEVPVEFGDIAFFSSSGPTADGRTKPEVLAPGFGILSARSSNISERNRSEEDLAKVSTPDERYWVNQGTSMSSPQAAGTVALLLEKYPTLTFEQMVGRLRSRARMVTDERTGQTVALMSSGGAVAPPVDLAFTELVSEPSGLRLRWFVGKQRAPTEYKVHKGFSNEGPFHVLSAHRITGTNPFTVVDTALEPGRTHVYRISVIDEQDLEDDLDTLRVDIFGAPNFVFRAPDPNPARTQLNLRFYLPPTVNGGEYRIDVVDVSGRRVTEVETGQFSPSGEERRARWNLTDDIGRRVAGGVYLVRLTYRLSGTSGTQPTPLVRRVVVLP